MAILTDATGRSSDEGIIIDAHGNSHQPDKTGETAIPYQFTFASIIQGASKSFIALGYDEAVIHNRFNALAMRRDCRLMALLRERKEGTCSRKWSLQIDDEDDPVQVAVRDGMTKIIQSIPRMLFLRRKARGWLTAGGKRFGNIGRDRRSHIGVNTEQCWWLLQSHYLRYCIAPVATLRHVFCVAETLHEHRPRFRNGNGIPSGCRRLGRETVARQ